ncbi:MAG TPA: hypothetical protein VGQ24_08930, partial [Gemmatimonadales bacterium]|nr:hypothetical protein [Gemmatimonadales bacterium]
RTGPFAVGSPYRVVGTDARGRFYGRQAGLRATPKGIVQDDSVPIDRWEPATGKRDTAGFYRVARSGLNLGLEPPFSATTVFSVSHEGGIAIVYPADYHVEFISPSGGRTIGKPNPWNRVRLSPTHKERWRRTQLPTCPSTRDRYGVIPLVENGETKFAKWGRQREPKDHEWPTYLPPFLRSAASFSPDGMLWVERTADAGEPPFYDVIDGSGRVIRKVVLRAGSRLLGFGKGTIYLVRKDSDELEYVQVFSTRRPTG